MALQWQNVSSIPPSYNGDGYNQLGNDFRNMGDNLGNYLGSLKGQKSNQYTADLLSQLNQAGDEKTVNSILDNFNMSGKTPYLTNDGIQALANAKSNFLSNQQKQIQNTNLQQEGQRSQQQFTDTGSLRSNLAKANELYNNRDFKGAYDIVNQSKQKYANTPEYDTIVEKYGLGKTILDHGQQYVDAATAFHDPNNQFTQGIVNKLINEPDDAVRKKIFGKEMIEHGYTDTDANDALYNTFMSPIGNKPSLTFGEDSQRLLANGNRFDELDKQLNDPNITPEQKQQLQAEKEALGPDYRKPALTSMSNPNDPNAQDRPISMLPTNYATKIDEGYNKVKMDWDSNQSPIRTVAEHMNTKDGSKTLSDNLLAPMGKDKVQYEDRANKLSNLVTENIRNELRRTNPELAEMPDVAIQAFASRNMQQDDPGIWNSMISSVKSTNPNIKDEAWITPAVDKTVKDIKNTVNIYAKENPNNPIKAMNDDIASTATKYAKLKDYQTNTEQLKKDQNDLFTTSFNRPSDFSKNPNSQEGKQYQANLAKKMYAFNISNLNNESLKKEFNNPLENNTIKQQRLQNANKAALEALGPKGSGDTPNSFFGPAVEQNPNSYWSSFWGPSK